jgi:hypothetical protein
MVNHECPDMSLTYPISLNQAERETNWRPAAGKKGMGTMKEMHVYKEWLCDEHNNIVYMPLSKWAAYYKLNPYKSGKIELWKSELTGKIMSIEKADGYGLLHKEFREYVDHLFFVGNADLDTPKLRQYCC